MFLVNSRFSLASATLTPSPPRGFKARAPLLPKLRGHFAEFLNHDSLVRLGILCPTTCVGLGYGRLAPSRRGFSRHHRITLLSPTHRRGHHHASPRHPKRRLAPGFTWAPGCALERAKPSGPRRLPLCVTPVNTLAYLHGGPPDPSPPPHPTCPKADRCGTQGTRAWVSTRASAWAVLRRYGNINPSSIDYACRPRLRSRLTQGGLAWPWNPWSFGARVSHPSIATHACILTPAPSTPGSLRGFTRCRTLPYHPQPLNTPTTNGRSTKDHAAGPRLRRCA